MSLPIAPAVGLILRLRAALSLAGVPIGPLDETEHFELIGAAACAIASESVTARPQPAMVAMATAERNGAD